MNQASSELIIVRAVAELRRRVGDWRRQGASIGLVPTMGAIHDGHLALVRAAREECDRVVASLFVNPTQFGENEDLSSYPRDEADDARMLGAHGVEILFTPTVAEMYPDGMATTVSVPGLAEHLCGAHRPGHFAGVATVVAKLLTECRPDRAYFGEKDYQQLRVVTRMARDLGLGAEIRGVPTVREADGLALSSRNAYLSAGQRRIAVALSQTLGAAASAIAGGAATSGEVARARAALIEAGFGKVDYVEVCDAATLEPLERVAPGRPARVLAAAWIGSTRLIDNFAIETGG